MCTGLYCEYTGFRLAVTRIYFGFVLPVHAEERSIVGGRERQHHYHHRRQRRRRRFFFPLRKQENEEEGSRGSCFAKSERKKKKVETPSRSNNFGLFQVHSRTRSSPRSMTIASW